MPIGSDPSHRDKLNILEALSCPSLAAHFPSYSVQEQTFHLEEALQELRAADFIVADLSLERPSCYYELGLAHALGIRAYLISEAKTPIHQADRRDKVIFYLGLEEYEEVLRSILEIER